MSELVFPFGKKQLSVNIEDKYLKAVLSSRLDEYIPEKEESQLIEDALNAPIGSLPLHELAKGKDKVVIICSDHTRPVPSKLIIPQMLKEIRKGNPKTDIKLLIATGFHRLTTRKELVDKFGEEIVDKEKIIIHDSTKDEDMIDLGLLPSGGRIWINKIAAEADLLCSEGFIEPHFFAGYSGGRKSVLPGVVSRKTVLANHCAAFIDSDKARTGVIDGNPIHKDMLYAARQAKLAFICNVIINAEKKVVYAVAGDVQEAHKKGVDFLSRYCKADSPDADIVISTNGGYPLDQNIYQSVKGMTAAEAAVRKGGVIIMLAACNDGHGGESFYGTFHTDKPLKEMYEEIMERSAEETIADQWESQILIRILRHAKVIFVSDAPEEMVRRFRMIPAKDLEEALRLAREIAGAEASIAVIRDGISLMVIRS